MRSHIVIPDRIHRALKNGQPLVALESTVISHGLAYPENLKIAKEMEATVQKAGAIPATIAILSGKIIVGLDGEQLERLARANNVRKCSRREIPIAVARGEDGATTVAGTCAIARMVGIRVFATGGIGGVHRGHPFDVSADLFELGRRVSPMPESAYAGTPICVVCAGAKSLLDLEATVEVLETQAVPMVGFQTDEFPAFYSPHSGIPLSVRADSAGEVAAILRVQEALGDRCGTLVTVPVPDESALSTVEAESAITEAVRRADERAISGQALTPFLLAQIAAITEGRSVVANRALLLNNCRVAAAIAVELASVAI